MELLRNDLYIKDLKGNTMTTGVSIINGHPVSHSKLFSGLGLVMEELGNAVPRDDDVWILSFPKSGAHWVYEIIGVLQNGKLEAMKEVKETTFVELHPSFLSIEKSIEDRPYSRVFSSHMRFKFMPEAVVKKCKFICVLRNPKSVAVSYYHHVFGMKSFDYNGSFDDYLDLHNQGIDEFAGSWFENATEYWDALHGKSNVMFLYYEDLKKNPMENIKKIANFLSINRDEDYLQKVVKLTQFDAMKKEIGKCQESKDFHGTLWKDGKTKFFRKGEVSDWKNYFTVARNEEFDQIYAEKMKNYNEITEKLQYE